MPVGYEKLAVYPAKRCPSIVTKNQNKAEVLSTWSGFGADQQRQFRCKQRICHT
jgi:hypothetical protein